MRSEYLGRRGYTVGAPLALLSGGAAGAQQHPTTHPVSATPWFRFPQPTHKHDVRDGPVLRLLPLGLPVHVRRHACLMGLLVCGREGLGSSPGVIISIWLVASHRVTLCCWVWNTPAAGPRGPEERALRRRLRLAEQRQADANSRHRAPDREPGQEEGECELNQAMVMSGGASALGCLDAPPRLGFVSKTQNSSPPPERCPLAWMGRPRTLLDFASQSPKPTSNQRHLLARSIIFVCLLSRFYL